jgi:hypothetical protein
MLVIVSTLKLVHLLMLMAVVRHNGLLLTAEVVSCVANINSAASVLRRGRHLVATSQLRTTALTLATVHHSSGFLLPSVGTIAVLAMH